MSLLATFIVLNLTGRTLNVISLAGLAFAVGMVLDAAIVVLENVVRLREKGVDAHDASLRGTDQVWGALLASTATTVAIFLPVVFMREVEGQLFSDLAITIAIAVIVSMLVAITILPLAAKRWLPAEALTDRNESLWLRITRFIMRITGSPGKRWALIAVLITLPLGASYALLPELDYLPPVKRDAVDAYFRMPPGIGEHTIAEEYVKVIGQKRFKLGLEKLWRPSSVKGYAIVGKDICPLLDRGKMVNDHYRNIIKAKLAGCGYPSVACYDVITGVDQYRIIEPKLGNAPGYFADLFGRMGTRIVLVRL